MEDEIEIILGIKCNHKVRIFGEKFVEKNKCNCNMIINNEQKELNSFYDFGKENEEGFYEAELTIKLKINNDFTDISHMFDGCDNISSIKIISFNTSKIENMAYLFNHCEILEQLPNISNWDISNVTNIKFIFGRCRKLKFIPDISKWNTNNLYDISGLFYECNSLKTLPDISKWNIENVIELNCIFFECSSLIKI